MLEGCPEGLLESIHQLLLVEGLCLLHAYPSSSSPYLLRCGTTPKAVPHLRLKSQQVQLGFARSAP